VSHVNSENTKARYDRIIASKRKFINADKSGDKAFIMPSIIHVRKFAVAMFAFAYSQRS
jgi:hypothetical protein